MAGSDSGSESDNEGGGLGNVNRLVMRPPGHTGKAKKGHLVFDASFEGGNLGKVEYVSEFEYDLYVRPDTCNPRYRLWFNFMVENVRADQRVIFNVVNFSKTKSLFREGMTPLVKSTSRPKWLRIPSKYVYYYRSPEHMGGYVLSFAFCFDREDDVYQFAYSYPYSHSRLQAFLDDVSARDLPYFRREQLTTTLQGRRVDLLTIGRSVMTDEQRALLDADGPDSDVKPRVVVITGRVHPGETPPSYVIQGLILFLLSQHPVAQVLRDYVTFKIVPMVNPDGVFLGNYRATLLGQDLNRSWVHASPFVHPVLHALKELILDLNKDSQSVLDIYLDVHAHSSLLGSFVYGNMYDDVYRLERHLLFPKLVAQIAEDFSQQNTIYNRDPLKAGTGRRYLCGVLHNRVNCYTMEVSFHGYHPNNFKGSGEPPLIPYSEQTYMRLGRNLSYAFLEYYKATGQVPAHLPQPPSPATHLTTSVPSKDIQGRKSVSRAGNPLTRGAFLPGPGSALVNQEMIRTSKATVTASKRL